MNDRKTHPPTAHSERRRVTDEPARTRAKTDGWDAYGNWMDRSRKSGGRHSAITRTLYSWSSYKNWAEKVRNSWDRDK